MMGLDQNDSLSWAVTGIETSIPEACGPGEQITEKMKFCEKYKEKQLFPTPRVFFHVVGSYIRRKLLGSLYPQTHSTQVDGKGNGMMYVMSKFGG